MLACYFLCVKLTLCQDNTVTMKGKITTMFYFRVCYFWLLFWRDTLDLIDGRSPSRISSVRSSFFSCLEGISSRQTPRLVRLAHFSVHMRVLCKWKCYRRNFSLNNTDPRHPRQDGEYFSYLLALFRSSPRPGRRSGNAGQLAKYHIGLCGRGRGKTDQRSLFRIRLFSTMLVGHKRFADI